MNTLLRRAALSALLLTADLWAAPASAADFTVNSTTDAPDSVPGDGVCASALGECTVRAAILEANALPGPDEVLVPAGTFPLANGRLDILDELALAGAGPLATILEGGGLGVFSSAEISRLTVRGASGTGIAIEEIGAEVTISLVDAVVEESSGTGINSDYASGEMHLLRTAVRNNHGVGIGLCNVPGPTLIEHSEITGNDGSGLTLSCGPGGTTALLKNSVVASNMAGGVIVGEGALLAEGSLIYGNTGGAGISVYEGGATVERTTIEGNDGPIAGGVLVTSIDNNSLYIADSAIVGNTSSTGTGGVSISGEPAFGPSLGHQVINATVSGNTGVIGGGISVRGDPAFPPNAVVIQNCTVTNNSA